jgi:ABC-type glycerol-3-phosphate transport system substrate-binding protein
MELNEFPVIDLEAPWWDQNAKNSLSIGKKLYFCPSDLILLHNNAASAVIFNKKMLRDYGIGDLYSLAASGKWTVDKLIAITKDIYQDINGDGIMDENDLYGIACYRDALLGIMHSAGGRICEKDEKDLPYLTLNSEAAVTALNLAFDLMYAPGAWNLHKELEPKGLPVYDITERMFSEDRVLFYSVLLRDVEQFRNMESDFGIIPVPKLTEAQPGYGSTVNQHVGRALAVPVTVKDKQRAGTIIEALTAESKYTLLPAYYDITLQRKVSRDNESEAMLDIIFASRIYDPGAIYNFGGYSVDLIMMTMTQNRNITSLYEKSENRAVKDIEKLIENLQKLD